MRDWRVTSVEARDPCSDQTEQSSEPGIDKNIQQTTKEKTYGLSLSCPPCHHITFVKIFIPSEIHGGNGGSAEFDVLSLLLENMMDSLCCVVSSKLLVTVLAGPNEVPPSICTPLNHITIPNLLQWL